MLSPAIGAICATVAFSQSALAEDFAVAAKSAMVATAQNPVSTVTTKTSAQEKQTVTRTESEEDVGLFSEYHIEIRGK
jgi:hypothetical protein